MVTLINRIDPKHINKIQNDILHISQFKLKTNKLHGFQAIGTNTTTNSFCIKMNDSTKKVVVNKNNLEDNPNLSNYVAICKANKWTTFSLWTKRKDIIERFFSKHPKPKNLILIYSNPTINKPITKIFSYFDKIFNNVSEDKYIDKQNCTGQQCITCLRCYKHSKKDTSNIIYEKVKGSKELVNICKACYSHKAINYRKHTMIPPLQRNSDLLQTKLKPIQIPKIIDRYFRFNHHGELIT